MHSFFLDFVMAGLLVAVIVYSIQLSKKIDTLNAIRSEITPVIGNLTTIMNQASANVARLKALSLEINTSLSQTLPKAQSLRDDLSFLVDYSERLAQRLEGKVYENRHQSSDFSLHSEHTEPQINSTSDVLKLHPDEPLMEDVREYSSSQRWGLLNALKEVR